MAATNINGKLQTWVPYEPTKDCSLGICSFYCPQWCYLIFPPPPPVEFSEDDGSRGGRTFSPLVITVIGVLASAFLIMSYYTIVSKYCGTFNSRRRRTGPGSDDDHHLENNNNFGQAAHLNDAWHFSPSNGLDEALVNDITVCKYKRGGGLVEGTDCAVCLSEFLEDESLRLLPKCGHAFHVQCIDTWLKSHSSCPLCRATILVANSSAAVLPPPPLPAPPPPSEAADNNRHPVEESDDDDDELLSAVESPVLTDGEGDEDAELPSNGDEAVVDIRDDIDEFQPIRRSFSMDCPRRRDRVSIAEALQMDVEEDEGAGSSRRCRDDHEHSKGSRRGRVGGLDCVISPVPMKRSFSGGRLSLTRHVIKGSRINAVLPV